MRRVLLLGMFLLSACDNSIQDAQKAVKLTLRDPESVQFRNVRKAEALPAELDGSSIDPAIGAGVCGEFNAKNSMGGYNDFRGFVWEKATGQLMTANKYGTLLWRGGKPTSGEYEDSLSGDEENKLPNDLQAVGWNDYCADRPKAVAG